MSDKKKNLSSPAECLAQILQTEEYADLSITLPGAEKTLKVHRMILAMWSPVFKAMLFGPMSEGDCVNLPEDHPEGFKFMLKYMYSGCTELPSVDLALHVYMLANKYQMDHLKIICSKFLKNSMVAVCVPQVLNVATIMEDEELIDKCTEILNKSADGVFSSPSMGSLNSKSLQKILDQDFYISSETIVFRGLLTWGRSQLKLRNEDITARSIRQEIDQYLPQVRFLTMTTSEFVKIVLPEYTFTIEELTKIQQLLESVEGIDIPEACSLSKIPRKFTQSQIQSEIILYYGQDISRVRGNKSYNEGEERIFISGLKCKRTIFLSKLAYVSNSHDRGQIIVRDSTHHDIASAEFDGQEIIFQKPLKLVTGQEYSFVLKGTQKSYYLHRYALDNNDLLSGYLTCYIRNITIHFWD